MNEQYEYIEFVYRPGAAVEISIEASPVFLEKTAVALEKRLQELGVKPQARLSEYHNNQFYFFHTSHVDMLNALRIDGWELVSSYPANSHETHLYKRALAQEQVENNPSLSDIAELIEVSSTAVVNGYLKLGWVLIETGKSQYSEHGYSISYCLAWSKKKGEPVYPEIKSDAEYQEKVIRDVVNKGTK